jgi:hypothetical protein
VDVQELRIGVDVGGQARVAVPHGGLGRAERDAPAAEQGAEGGPESVDVECSPSLIPLGDTSRIQVAVEDPDESGGDGEEERVAWEAGRDGLAEPTGISLEGGKLIGHPTP